MSARNRRNLSTLSSIDMTPLVDLTFILLIVFMVAAPALEYAVDVSPPSLDAGKITKEKSIIVSINSKGEYFLGDELLSIPNLKKKIIRINSPKKNFYIRADAVRPYGEIIRLMKLLRDIGIINVSLVTDAES